MAEVFAKAMDISLERKDPKKKLERRLERERKQSAAQEKSCPGKIQTEGSPTKPEEKGKSRYVPSEVRERVLARADHRCEYRGEDGTRCSSRTGLQIEHSRPFAIYRSHEERFLKVLCGCHNLFQAERVYGSGFIRAKIVAKRSQKASQTIFRQSFTSNLFH
jgi:hypothetical protein